MNKYDPKRMFREWKQKNAWDLNPSELNEIVDVDDTVKEFTFDKFLVEEVKKRRVIDKNLTPEVCVEAGGVWAGRISGGGEELYFGEKCIIPEVGFISFAADWDDATHSFRSDLTKRTVAMERRFGGAYYNYDIDAKDVDDVALYKADECRLSLYDDGYYVRCYVNSPMMVKKTDNGIELSTVRKDLIPEMIEKDERLSKEMHERLKRKEPFDIDALFRNELSPIYYEA